MVFSDRRTAGRRLAARLTPLAEQEPVVVALPRGGVPVAVEVARALRAPLQVLEVRKLGAPIAPELAVGAVAEDGTVVIDEAIVRDLGVGRADLERTLERELRELRRRMELYGDGRAPVDLAERTVVVVDDGLATGLTALAAVRALRARGAARIVLAVPVASRPALALLGQEADDVVPLSVPADLGSIGRWYEDFAPVSDEEILALLAEADAPPPGSAAASREVALTVGGARLRGDLTLPDAAAGLVIFAHGSGSGRLSPRNRAVAQVLNEAGLATLLLDLLSVDEGGRRERVFDISLLTRRLGAVTRWAVDEAPTRGLPIGLFGASTGAAAALGVAAAPGEAVRAVVCRGGRPDLAADRLPAVRAPTLLIVGSLDGEVLALNRRAAALLRAPHRIALVEGAGHLFEEPGALDEVARLAARWFRAYLISARALAGAAGH